MKQTNPLTQLIFDFFKEMVLRVKTKSPKFFQILSWIFAATALATYLPETISYVAGLLDFPVPDWLNTTVNWVVAKCATLGFIVSVFTTESKAVGVTQEGNIIKMTDDKKLPFTSAMEQKKAIKNDLPVVESITPLTESIKPKEN